MYNKEIIVTDFAKTGGNLGGILHQSKHGILHQSKHGILHQSKHRDSMIPLTEKYDRI